MTLEEAEKIYFSPIKCNDCDRPCNECELDEATKIVEARAKWLKENYHNNK